MFNIFGSTKKTLKFHHIAPAQDAISTNNPENKNKIDALSGFIDKVFKAAIAEYKIIRQKMQNLSQTNYNLGMKHLNEGNLKEAIFRFKITKKFWPENYEAYYQLIYCMILVHNFKSAQIVINELLEKNPSYQPKIDQLIKKSEAEYFGTPHEELESHHHYQDS